MKTFFRALLSLFVAVTAAAQTVSVGQATASCGSTVTVPVTISQVSGLSAIEFHVGYASSVLTLTNVTTGAFNSDFLFAYNAGNGTGRVAMAHARGRAGSGSIAMLTFSVAGSASGTFPLTLSNVRINNQSAAASDGQITVTCQTTAPPDAPSYVSPANGATGIASPVELRWNASPNATQYRVYFGTNSTPPLYGTTADTQMTVAPEGGTTYFWSVEAVNANGAATGAVWQFTTAEGPRCDVPTSPALTGPAGPVTSGSTFTLTWTTPAAATEYVLEESATPSMAGSMRTTYTTASASLTRSFAEATTRYYRVRGRNSAGGCDVEGDVSAVIAVQFVPAPAATALRVVPVAGSVPGNFGSYFRTALQLHNPTNMAMSGTIVFHRQGSAGTAGDPSIAYTIAPGATVSWKDVVLDFGIGTAIGSLDIVAAESNVPVAIARIYNDAGSAGTTGLTIEALDPAQALQAGQRGQLVAPIEPARARMNVGLRSLSGGATIELSLRDRSGAVLETTRRSFAATWFEQFSIGSLFTTPLTGDETVQVDILSGSAFVYASITDNVTQDPSVHFARTR